MKLWKYNKIIGEWRVVRECTQETAQQWLDVFQSDEPGELFKLSKRQPK